MISKSEGEILLKHITEQMQKKKFVQISMQFEKANKTDNINVEYFFNSL